MHTLIIPIIVLIIIIHGLYKQINIYDSFIVGVLEGLKNIKNIFPSIFTMILAINILLNSNIIIDISNNLPNIFIPKEVFPLIFIRPLSGSSSLIILNNIYKEFGTDTYIGRISSLIMGCTDTTIYIITLYLSSIKIKNTKYIYPLCLTIDLICVIVSIIVIRTIFY